MLTSTAAQPEVRPAPSHDVMSIEGKLCVAITRNNEEATLAECLAWGGVGVSLPQRLEWRVQGRGEHRRKRRVWTPIFGGFVFVGGGDQGRELAQQSRRRDGSRRVLDFITVADRSQAKLRSELQNIERVLGEQPEAEPFPWLRAGILVEVKAGHAFEGMQGFVERSVDGKDQFCIAVTMLGRSLPVQIDPIYLEPLN